MKERPTPETDDEYAEAQDFYKSAFVVRLEQFQEVKRQRDEALALARELRDALEQCRDDSVELKSEWEWKRKDAGQRSEREYFAVECHIEMADAALTKANQLLP